MRARAFAIAAAATIAACKSGNGPECAVLTSVDAQSSDPATSTSPSLGELDIDFGSDPIGQTETVVARIHYEGSNTLDFFPSDAGSVLSPEFGLQLPSSIANGGVASVPVTFQPYKTGQVSSSFTLEFQNGPSCPESPRPLTINVTGNGIQLCVRVIPDVLDFGITLIGTTVTKRVSLVTCSGESLDGVTATLRGNDANLFTLGTVPTSLPPLSQTELDISYSPTSTEAKSIAIVTFTGSDDENALLALFGEPTDLVDGGLPCLPGDAKYCCLYTLAPAKVGTSDPSGCRTCVTDGGPAYWSNWPLGSSCDTGSQGHGYGYGDAGVCLGEEGADGSNYSCFCEVSYPQYAAICSTAGLTDQDAGIYPCCSGVCVLPDAGASLGVCTCGPGYDGGASP